MNHALEGLLDLFRWLDALHFSSRATAATDPDATFALVRALVQRRAQLWRVARLALAAPGS